MVSLSSTREVVAALGRARHIVFSAYVLRKGPVLDALKAACRRGADVTVRVEHRPFKIPTGPAENAHITVGLRRLGADAAVTDSLHLKGAVTDHTVYLDDRNWANDGGDTIVRDTFRDDAKMVEDAIEGKPDLPTPFLATMKEEALEIEERLIRSSQRGDEVTVESESFGWEKTVLPALANAARRGAHVRLLVAARELRGDGLDKPNRREAGQLRYLEDTGVDVRVCNSDEKLALVNNRGWIGSANASGKVPHGPPLRDWCLRTNNHEIVQHAHAVFEQHWQHSKPFPEIDPGPPPKHKH